MNFKNTYQRLLRLIEKEEFSKELLLFPATPLSLAVYIGRAQLKQISPNLIVYDKDGDNYIKTITIKKRG